MVTEFFTHRNLNTELFYSNIQVRGMLFIILAFTGFCELQQTLVYLKFWWFISLFIILAFPIRLLKRLFFSSS